MEQYVSEQEHDPTLEDQYGEPNDGPEVEDDPRLDAEVTDETTFLGAHVVPADARDDRAARDVQDVGAGAERNVAGDLARLDVEPVSP